jgi:hypothetical protein
VPYVLIHGTNSSGRGALYSCLGSQDGTNTLASAIQNSRRPRVHTRSAREIELTAAIVAFLIARRTWFPMSFQDDFHLYLRDCSKNNALVRRRPQCVGSLMTPRCTPNDAMPGSLRSNSRGGLVPYDRISLMSICARKIWPSVTYPTSFRARHPVCVSLNPNGSARSRLPKFSDARLCLVEHAVTWW